MFIQSYCNLSLVLREKVKDIGLNLDFPAEINIIKWNEMIRKSRLKKE